MMFRRSSLAALGAAALLLYHARAYGQETNWGKWGPDDEIGTLNYITPEVILHAATLVKQGKVINLGLPVEPGHPTGGARRGRIYRYMTSTAQGAGNAPGFAEDHLFAPIHGPTHWDGLGHIFGDGKLYNGFDAQKNISPHGVHKCGIHNAADKVVTRGVLVDIARYKGVKWLDFGYRVTPEDIKAAAKKQGVDFRQGDVVLVRTGWMRRFYELGWDAYNGATPGIGWEVTQWLKKIKASAVGVDNTNVEVKDPKQGNDPVATANIGHPEMGQPNHFELLHNQGMMIGDLMYLDELAADCAADGVYEFLFVGVPLNLPNATGSPINPQAIK